MIKKLLFSLSAFVSVLTIVPFKAHSQWSSVQVHQPDARFRLTATHYYSTMSDYDEVRFNIKNNTSTEYMLVVETTIDWTCNRTSTFKLGINKVVYLRPNGSFTPDDDWVHSKETTKEECIKKASDGKYTTIQSIQYRILDVRDMTAEKAQKQKYDAAISAGNTLYGQRNYQDAINKYREALAIKPGESYPTQRIASCNQLLAKAAADKIAADKLAAAKKAAADKAAADKIAADKATALAAQQAARKTTSAATGPSASSGTKSTASYTSGTTGTSRTTASSTSTSQAKTTAAVNTANLPSLVRTTDGKYYQKGSDGQFKQVSAQAYQAAKQEQTTLRQQAANIAQQEKNAAAKAQAEATLQNLRAQQAEQARLQEEKTQAINTAVSYGAAMVGNILADAQRAREQREAYQAKQRLTDEKNAEIGNAMVKSYLPIAETGDEQAMIKVITGYDYAKKTKEKVEFLNKMYLKNKSPLAYNSLKEYYTAEANSYIYEHKTHMRKGIGQGILGVGLGVGVGYFLSDYILNNSPFGDETIDDAAYYVTGLGGIIGGSILTISSLMNFAQTGYKKNSGYLKAREGLRNLDGQQPSVAFAPSYNPINKSYGLALRMRF